MAIEHLMLHWFIRMQSVLIHQDVDTLIDCNVYPNIAVTVIQVVAPNLYNKIIFIIKS